VVGRSANAGGDRPHPERKIPRVMRRGFEGDVVAEGLELGNGPPRFSSLVAAPGHGGLIRHIRGMRSSS
jgi:hypothetical protein